jgi:Leucine-rich repeat (LRR) protein
MCLRIRLILILIFAGYFSGNVYAQGQLLDSLTLDTLTAYTSLEAALKDPDKVIRLELRRKHLKAFPKEIFQFKNLQYLDLSKNDIEEIPAEIAQLTDLQYFSISKNELTTLPPQIGELKHLFYLNVNQNNLSSLPPQIGQLESLKNMDLWSNNIDKFPDEIRNLKELRILDLRVILIPDQEQERVQAMLPWAKVYFSPYCKCSE